MPTCKGCGDEVEALQAVKAKSKTLKLCEDCAERAVEDDAIAQESESVVQQMMGFKGHR